jgi:hypothetical protein
MHDVLKRSGGPPSDPTIEQFDPREVAVCSHCCVCVIDILFLCGRCKDMDVLGPYPTDSDAFDVLISDVLPANLPNRISEALRIPYLAEMEVKPGPVDGIVFKTRGDRLRVLVSLPVSRRAGRSVATNFILDSGAPITYVASSVLDALGLTESCLARELLRINGIKAYTSVSDTTTVPMEVDGKIEKKPCHFVGLNILGIDYLDRAEIKLEIDMKNEIVIFDSPNYAP